MGLRLAVEKLDGDHRVALVGVPAADVPDVAVDAENLFDEQQAGVRSGAFRKDPVRGDLRAA